MTSCVWDGMVGQRRAATHLRRAVESGRVAHAYLFVGPTGVGKKTAATALACALLCGDQGCGGCRACHQVKAGTHPDLRVVQPEGAATYNVEQIRELVHDAVLKPVEATRKVYILEDVDRFNAASANAFLKTLEEPPPSLVMVLLAASYEDVLPTIASRCQIVRFAPVGTSDAIATVMERTGAGEDEARAALAAAGSVMPRAVEFLRSASRRNARSQILDIMKRLPAMDGGDVLRAARDLLAAVKAPLDDVKEVQAEEMAAAGDFLGKGAVKKLGDRHKRELTAREREGVSEILSVAESWLRDCLVMAKGAPELVANRDTADATEEVAAVITVPAALRGLEAVKTARERIAYNVNPQLAVEAMLFDIQEVLECPR